MRVERQLETIKKSELLRETERMQKRLFEKRLVQRAG
jgi:hypothetical protein